MTSKMSKTLILLIATGITIAVAGWRFTVLGLAVLAVLAFLFGAVIRLPFVFSAKSGLKWLAAVALVSILAAWGIPILGSIVRGEPPPASVSLPESPPISSCIPSALSDRFRLISTWLPGTDLILALAGAILIGSRLAWADRLQIPIVLLGALLVFTASPTLIDLISDLGHSKESTGKLLVIAGFLMATILVSIGMRD